MNKKRLFSSITIFTIAILAAFNTSINTNENGLSDISLDNVEALAQESNTPDCVSAKGFCIENTIRTDHVALK